MFVVSRSVRVTVTVPIGTLLAAGDAAGALCSHHPAPAPAATTTAAPLLSTARLRMAEIPQAGRGRLGVQDRPARPDRPPEDRVLLPARRHLVGAQAEALARAEVALRGRVLHVGQAVRA